MRCHICNKALSEAEILVAPDGTSFEPCATCLDVIFDAAYSDGFHKEDPLDDPELNEDGFDGLEFGTGAVETLDPGAHLSFFDQSDTGFQGDYSDE